MASAPNNIRQWQVFEYDENRKRWFLTMVDEYKNINNGEYGEDEEGEIDIGQPSNHYAPDKIGD